MKSQIRALTIAAGILFATTTFAQKTAAPAVPASSSTGITATAPQKAASGTKPQTAATPSKAMPSDAATGGGGKVWVNTKSKTYHCEGTKFYGKTKVGEYMTEADAKTKGNHADHGKACVTK